MGFRKNKNWEKDIFSAMYDYPSVKRGITRGTIRKRIAKKYKTDWRKIPVEGINKGTKVLEKKGYLR